MVSGHIDDAAAAIGARCVMVRRIAGAERPNTSEVVQREPPRGRAVRGIDGPIRAAVDVTVEPLDETRLRVAIAVDFSGHGVGELLVPLLVRRQARKEMPANLAGLKERLESPTG